MTEDPLKPSAPPLSDAEAEEARRLFAALQAFRAAYPDMTVSQAAALLHVASEPDPVSMSRLRAVLGVAASTATRAVLTLSDARRGGAGAAGPGLVRQSVDPADKRWRLTAITGAGLAVVRGALSARRGR